MQGDDENGASRPHRTSRPEVDATGRGSGSTAPNAINATLAEGAGSVTGLRPTSATLIHVGSVENGLAQAGLSVDLSGVTRLRFGRIPGQVIRPERDGNNLHVGIPLAWVSGAHADLAIHERPGRAPGLRLTDLDSRNGTAIEGRDLRGSTELLPGQVFEIGRSFWMVRATPGPSQHTESVLDPTGTSNPTLARVYRNFERLATSNLPIMMIGETGTGKDYLARAIHQASRPNGAFIHANLLAIPMSELLMGEGEKKGLLERAAGGTIYVDELASLERDAQTKLACLMSYADPEGEHGDRADVRVIVASTRDLRPLVERGDFRADLYARLSVYEADIPALRERREDLGLLLRRLARQEDGSPMQVETSAFRRILGHRWPFNVRELDQMLRAARVINDGDGTLSSSGLDELLRIEDVPRSPGQINEMRDELLHQLIDHHGDTAAVARSLGRGNREVESWLRRFELDPGVYRQN